MKTKFRLYFRLIQARMEIPLSRESASVYIVTGLVELNETSCSTHISIDRNMMSSYINGARGHALSNFKCKNYL